MSVAVSLSVRSNSPRKQESGGVRLQEEVQAVLRGRDRERSASPYGLLARNPVFDRGGKSEAIATSSRPGNTNPGQEVLGAFGYN